MNPIDVDTLITQIAAAIYDRRLRYLAVSGTLSDWRRHRYGSGSGELVTGSPPTAIRLHANQHATATMSPLEPPATTVPLTRELVRHHRLGRDQRCSSRRTDYQRGLSDGVCNRT